MVITGAGPGIMQAAMEGAGRTQSMGVSIELPREQRPNPVIAGDSKNVTMKYFFTRKLMLVKESKAFICLPGGFGTVEEVIELLTWNQLGLIRKPVVMLDVQHYWTKLFEWMDGAVDAGFVRRSHRMLAQRAHTVDEALALALAPAPETPSKWLDRDVTGQIPITPSP
jgi:uncharacterized protein (TIGR00730 family)